MLNRWRDLDRKVGLPLLRFSVEQVLLAPAIHRVTRRLFARRLRLVEPLVDRAFYLRQLRPHWSRRAAEREAALHYHLVGRFHKCAPHPDFDPVAYLNDHPHLTWMDDPLLDHATRVGQPAPARGTPVAQEHAATVVVLHHARGGGSDHYLDLLEERLRGRGTRVVRLVRLTLTAPLFRATDRSTGDHLSPVFDLAAEPEALMALLGRVGAGRLVVNHVVDLQPADLATVTEAGRRAVVPIEVHLHDYLFLCPRINLIDARGVSCADDPGRACAGCVFATPGGRPLSRAAWRAAAHRFLAAAAAIVAPSRDVAERHRRVWPDLAIAVQPPEDDATVRPPYPRPAGQVPTIAILGRLNLPKGFEVVLPLAEAIGRAGAPARLVLIGQSIDDAGLRRRGVVVHGRYRADDVQALIDRYDPDLVFLPSVWPETWSFVLSAALEARRPVAAFDLGAPAERLRRLGFGTLLPLDRAQNSDRLLRDLMAAVDGAARPSAADPVATCC